jgi:hypothetical protein
MTKCIYPTCNERATIGCTCHLGAGWFCEEHLENHLEAHRFKDQMEKQ